jgi:hypothetical protein
MDMNAPSTPPLAGHAAQQRYARLLALGSRFGLAVLVASFVAYVSGLIAPVVALEALPSVWSQPVAQYLKVTGLPTGWGWLALADHGDVLNLVGIALLASCSLPCLLAVIPCYARERDRAFMLLCALEVLVLVFAASGIIDAGH